LKYPSDQSQADGKKCARRPQTSSGQTVDGKIIGFAEMVGKKNGEQKRRKIGRRRRRRLVVGNAR